jgi:predicted protein tyrosine phosphatase
MKTHLLFVCSSNLDRSPAAESLFEGSKEYEAKSCGILPHAEKLISKEAVLWADKIFCMEHSHKAYIMQKFPESLKKEMIVLNIPNNLCRNDPRLLEMLKEKLAEKV